MCPGEASGTCDANGTEQVTKQYVEMLFACLVHYNLNGSGHKLRLESWSFTCSNRESKVPLRQGGGSNPSICRRGTSLNVGFMNVLSDILFILLENVLSKG